MTPKFPMDGVRFDADGLVPVVAQEETTGEVLMVAWANRESLQQSLKTGRMTYYSRSRKELWEKGATSGNMQSLVGLHLDCDGDAVLALVRSAGPSCHEGTDTCFHRAGEPTPGPVLFDLANTIGARKEKPPEGSYTAKLLADPTLAGKKIGEEATELVMALARESEDRVAAEAADLFYHALVACAGRGVALHDVLEVLGRRRA